MTKAFIRATALKTFLSVAFSGFLAFHASAADLKGYATPCPEKQQICVWFKPVAVLPKGWTEDEEWSYRYKALFLFQNGDRSTDKPVMYVHLRGAKKNETLEQFIEEAQKAWKGQKKGSTIEKLADFERGNKPSFKVFLYKNPSVPEQAFELTAFMQDQDSANPSRTYFFEAVLICPNKEELERAKPAFYELIASL